MKATRWWLGVLAVGVAVSGCGGCGGSKQEGLDRMAVREPGDERPRTLAPLPEPPKLELSPEALGGAAGALAVVAARPQGDIRGEVRPTVTFSKPVKSLEMVEAQREADKAHPFARLEPAVSGEWRWLGSSSAEFVPQGPVPYSTSFQVTVSKGLAALDGSTLAQDFTFSFNTPRVQVQDVAPARGFAWLKPEDPIRVLLNQPVRDADLIAAARFEVEGEAAPWRVQVLARASIAQERRAEEEKALREGRRYERLPHSAGGSANQQTRYTLAPEKPFPKNRKIRLVLAASLHGEQGQLTMEKDEVLEWRTFGPLELRSARMCLDGASRCPFGPLILTSSNPLQAESLKAKLAITPKVELDWDSARGWSGVFAVPGKFHPGTAYKVQLAQGLVDELGERLDTPFEQQVSTTDLEPRLSVGGYVGLIEARGAEPRLPVDVANLKTLDVKLWRLSLQELVQALAATPALPTRAADLAKTQALGYPRNQPRAHPIELAEVFGGQPTGAVLAKLDSPELAHHPREGYRTVVQVTDLAVHTKVGPKRSLAWVTRLSTGQSVASADVSVLDATGAVQWSGKSDADGLVDLPGVVELRLPQPRYRWEVPQVMVAATLEGDTSVTVSNWSSGVEPYEFDLASGWEGKTPEPAGFLFTDRGIYRPGDKVYVKGVARFHQVGKLLAPEKGSTLSLQATNARGEKLTSGSVKVSEWGTFAWELDVPQDAPTGYFSVEAQGATAAGPIQFNETFLVAEYRAPQFKVDVEAAKKALVSGEALEGRVFARYLFGGAMADARVKWSAHRTTISFAPETAPGFVFGQETWWWDDNAPQDSNGFFASGEGVADARGAFELKAGQTETPGGKTYSYTVEAEVQDVNRQTVAGRAEVTVHPAAFYVGLKSPSGFLQAGGGKEYDLEAVVVDPAGQRVAGRKVAVAIASRTWKSVKKKDASGGFITLSEPSETQVHSCELTSAETAVPCRFKPPSAGFFVVRASVVDDQRRKQESSIGLYATGPGFVAWQRNDTDRIDLLPDKTSYDVGEVAHVLVKSPYPEAQALVTVEREGVLDRRTLTLKGSVVTLDIPITEEMVPNVFAGVVLMRPRVAQGGLETGDDPGRPNARFGLVKLGVEKKTKRLAVKVSTDRAEYRPGDEVKVDVALADHRGKGERAEVTLWVVDEAVLRLTDYHTPDPLAQIYTARPLSVRIGAPLLNLVRRRSFGEKGEEQGGGGGAGEGRGMRSNFKTTALFLPTLETSADGHASIRFKLPDNLTAFRIMAVAITAGDRYGSGETSIKVNKPVLALPALPRFARVGDRFEAGVVVHSYGAGAGDVIVSAQAQGAELTGPAERRVQVAEGSPQEVRFGFTAVSPGIATFRFRVTKGPDSDGVEQKLPIELPVALEAVATYGDTTDVRVEGVAVPKDVWPNLGGLEVTLASTALGNFQQGFRQLIDYPYGCLEQQSSRLVPFVALRELSGKFGLAWPSPHAQRKGAQDELNAWLNAYLFDTLDVSGLRDPDEVVSATTRSIVALQAETGAFRYWSEDSCPSSWASAYATLALHRAREVGFAVPADRLARAEAYLGKVATGQCSPCERLCPDETRVFASWVLARMHRPKASTYAELYARRDKLPLFGQALLADAMFIGGGDRGQAKSLLQEIVNHAKESPSGVHFEETHGATYATLWHSDARTTGVVLMTLADVQPDHPFVSKIARYLASARQGDGRWRSTQEAAFSLMGLVEVVRAKEKEVPDYQATVALGGAPLLSQAFQGRSMRVQAQTIPMEQLLAKAGGDGKLAFRKEGQGVLYYSALLRYAPKQLPTASLENGLFVQRWFEPYAGGGQATKFYAGDLVRVRVRVATRQERHWAAFEVPLPAGLEPVDTALATTARLARSPVAEAGEGYEYEDAPDQVGGTADEGGDRRWAFEFWSPFNHVEQRDARVVLFADHLPPGVHTHSFVARATTPGTYVLKPARGELMYEPEVWGRSEGGSLEVALPAPVARK